MNLKLLTIYCLSVLFVFNSCLIRKANKRQLVSKYSEEYFEKNDSAFKIIETQSGRKFAIGGHYIFDLSNSKKHIYPKINTHTTYLKNGIHEVYSITKIDKENRIWILVNYGEWGGGIYVFDTNENEYENIPTNHLSKLFAIPDSAFYFLHFNPVEMYENKRGVYIYSYLSHLGNCESILYHFNELKPEIKVIKTNHHYENPNVFNNYIYIEFEDSCEIFDLESYINKKIN